MQIIVNNMSFPDNDHLWLGQTEPADYVEEKHCLACNTLMIPYAMIQNKHGEVGLETSLCPKCGHTQRTRNLSPEYFSTHFTSKWLKRRDEEIVETDYVYSKTKEHLPPAAKILDLGCGLGGSLLAFKNRGYQVYGVEPSEHRANIGKSLMPSIEVGTAEEYLKNTEEKFDLIYLFDVIQFVKDPYSLIRLANKRLSKNGKIWFKLGVYHHRSNFSQFVHFSMLRNYLNLYSLKDFLNDENLYPIQYQKEPIELLLSKQKHKDTDSIIESAEQLELPTIESFAKKTLHLNRLRLFGRTKLSYLNRKTNISLVRPLTQILPVSFVHQTSKIPVLFK